MKTTTTNTDVKSKLIAFFSISNPDRLKSHFNMNDDELADFAITQSSNPLSWIIDTNWSLMTK